MASIVDKFNHLVKITTNKDFLDGKILCNDIPIFIADYDIEDETDFLSMVDNLKNTLLNQNIKVLSIDLYDLVIEILKSNQDDWDWIMSEDRNKDELFDELKGILSIEGCIVPKIAKKIKDNEGQYDLLFLTGCGNVYPYLRTHTILNNLHTYIKKPLIVFFPGVSISKVSPYAAFNLFGRIDEGNDYRAANIFQIRGI